MGITITSATILGAPPAPQPAALPVELTVEELARALHEAGRAAVEAGLVVNPVPGNGFYEWDQISVRAQEGRRVQARALLARFTITPRAPAIDADQAALLAQIPGHPSAEVCEVDECMVCAVRDCPAAEPLHYDKDGCPVCEANPPPSVVPTPRSEPPGASSR